MEAAKLKDSIKVLLAIILLTILNFYIPILSILILFIWPVPVVYLAVKHGMKQTAITIVIAALINGVFFSPVIGLITIIGFGFVGFVLGGSLNEDFPPMTTLIFTIFSVLISHVLTIYILRYLLGFNFSNIVNEMMRFLGQSQELSNMKQMVETQLTMLRSVFPSLLVVSSVVTAIFNYYISLWFLNRQGFRKKTYKLFRYWYFPRWVISFGIIICLIFKTNPFFVNLNIVLFFFSFLQGLAVCLYYISRKSKSLFLKWIFFVLILFIPLLPILITLTGLIDMWFDFRKLRRREG